MHAYDFHPQAGDLVADADVRDELVPYLPLGRLDVRDIEPFGGDIEELVLAPLDDDVDGVAVARVAFPPAQARIEVGSPDLREKARPGGGETRQPEEGAGRGPETTSPH